MNGKREMIKELTNAAWSILVKYENEEKIGLLTREEAQNIAISRIQYLRYGDEGKDYFWITDMVPNMVIHPYRPDLNGKNLSNFSDPHGKKLFVEFVKTVEKSKHGYVDYMWQWKDDSLHIVPKLSYVQLFEPWKWVIGTGIYIEDVKKEIKALTNKLLWISIGITALIAFLLFYISRNSLKIEFKRVEAEKKLQESKNKYKTLVEAATEGLIMLIDGKITFLNSFIVKITGYENSEMINRSFNELISGNNNKILFELFSKAIIDEGQYEVNLNKKKGGYTETLITASIADFSGKAVNILIIKSISNNKDINFSGLDYQKLINLLNIGFFRVEFALQGEFIFANDTAIRIFGFNTFNELSESSLLNLITNPDDRKSIQDGICKTGYIKNRIVNITGGKNNISIVSLTIVVLNNENSGDTGTLICDGIIEDITNQEKEKEQIKSQITELKSHLFLIEQPVANYLIPFYTLDINSTIGDAIKLLSVRKTDNLILTSTEKDYVGILTDTDIRKRVIALNLNMDNPVYLIMSSPVFHLNINSSVFEAITFCEEKNINHLPIKNETGELSGVLRLSAIYKLLKESLSFYILKVNRALTINELKEYFNAFQLFIRPLINSGISVIHITSLTSSFSDSVMKRVIELSVEETGVPLVNFSFICLGSEGRKEETLFTDQDNAIIYEEGTPEKSGIIKNYFNKLGKTICSSLNHIGYSYCYGDIMANNPKWAQPVSVWENYFANWMNTPEPQNLLEATIFFDFRNIFGDPEFTERLRNKISDLSKKHSLFIYHMANYIYSLKPLNIPSEKSNELFDLKPAVNFIVMFARLYALQYNIWQHNTIYRLNALKENRHISILTCNEMLYAYNFLMKLRFKNQVFLSEQSLPLSNHINLKNLTVFEYTILKKIISQFQVYKSKIASDFRITG